jgi:hypothetical protein
MVITFDLGVHLFFILLEMYFQIYNFLVIGFEKFLTYFPNFSRNMNIWYLVGSPLKMQLPQL